jgi:hypothetical protein
MMSERRGGGDGCSICGAAIGFKDMSKHKCNPRVLRAIDAAHARGDDYEPPNNRTESDRLAEGYKMLRMSGDDNGE